MSDWGFSNAIAFAVAMTIRDMSEEREKSDLKHKSFTRNAMRKLQMIVHKLLMLSQKL